MKVNQEINGLRYEFVHRHGHYMMLHRDTGLLLEELSEIQLRMLESNAIPRLLPLEIQEIDFQIHLLYKLTSKRMLAHVLKIEGISRSQYLKLLYTVICTLDESGNYMLHEDQYLLKENFIFIGNDFTDVYLTYVPLRQMKEEKPLYRQISSLVEQVGSRLKEKDRKWMSELLEACSETFNLQGFKQKLLERMGEPMEQTLNVQEEQSVSSDSTPSVPWKQAESRLFHLIQEEKPNPASKREAAPLTQRTKFMLLAAFCLILILIWRNYLDHSSEANLFIAAGLSMLITDAWFVICYIGFHPKRESTREKFFSYGSNRAGNEISSRKVNSTEQALPQQHEPKQGPDLQDYYRNLHLHTTLLSAASSPATVFLGAQPAPAPKAQAAQAGPCIEFWKDGNKQKILLQGNSFLIGRGDTEVDYVINEAGISRLHTEIFRAVEGYGVKDMGSKNGTYLNGEALIPYQAYKLQDGDTIRILRNEIVFQVS